MDASNDGSESVDQFLARIASLNAKQGLEEAERSRRMEEEMLQARKERQARRAGILHTHAAKNWIVEVLIFDRARAVTLPLQNRPDAVDTARWRKHTEAQPWNRSSCCPDSSNTVSNSGAVWVSIAQPRSSSNHHT